MGAEDKPTQLWGFKVLDGEGGGGRNGVSGGINDLNESLGLVDFMMKGASGGRSAQSDHALYRWILLTHR